MQLRTLSIWATGIVLGGAAGAAEPPRPRWTASMTLGYSSGSPAGPMEAAMRRAGLADSLAGLGITLGYPSSGEGGFAGAGSVSYALGPRLALKAFAARRLALGSTAGYSGPLECCPADEALAFLDAQYRVTSTAALLLVQAGPLRAGAGPSLNAVSLESFGDREVRHQRQTRPGLVLDAELAFPERSRVFLALGAQYRYVAPFHAGPLNAVDGRTSRLVAVVPPTRLSFSHRVLSVGLGVRF